MNNDKLLKILKYWYSQELLLPQTIENPSKINNFNQKAFRGTLSEASNFIQNTKHHVKPGYGWEYILYGGIYKIEKIKQTLINVLNVSDDFEERTQYGNAALYAINIDQNLLPKKDGLQISTAPWALNSICVNKNTSKLDYSDFENISNYLTDWLNNEEFETNFTNVFNIIDEKIVNDIGANFLFEKDLYQVLATQKKLENIKEDTIETDILNSFYTQDLKKTIDSVSLNKNIDLIRTYLEMDESSVVKKRIDIVKNIDYVYDVLSPENIPIACWPSENGYPLAYSQQFAINSILNRLSRNTGLYSVNGPPGTGKTTMLRDLIAMIITERAQKIATLDKPSDLFKSAKQSEAWKTDDYQRWFSPLKEIFLGDEIVVASSNNGAVENVTLEIPASESIDKKWLDKIDFFKTTGDRLISGESWGSGAACLGNSKNKSRFISNFWYDDQQKHLEGFQSYLKKAKDIPEETSIKKWEKAKKEFLSSVEKVKTMKEFRLKIKKLPEQIQVAINSKQIELDNESSKLQTLIQTLQHYQEKVKELTNQQEPIQLIINNLDKVISQDITKSQSCNKEILDIQKQIELHFDKKLSFFEVIIDWLAFKGKRNKSWNEKAIFLEEKEVELQKSQKSLKENIKSKQKKLKKEQLALAEITISLVETRSLVSTTEENIHSKENDINNLRNSMKNLKSKLDSAFQNRNKYEKRENDVNSRELSSPWMDNEFHLARADVFCKALNLHKALIDSNANRLRNNLFCLIDILENKVKANTKFSNTVEHAWATLFFFVPVVSTTFASFGRLFEHLWGKKIGWVLIDEAGQASAQAAVGAIMRAKRVVTVGDPLQLEPIIGLPSSIQDMLRKEAGAHENSLSEYTSVQKRADFSEIHGTYLSSDEENNTWVGSPLRVHRRCCSPMFEISNVTTYNGLMVHGKKKVNERLDKSQWIDVNSSINSGHWIEEEGVVTGKIIKYLSGNDVESKDIYIISPFKDVVKGLKDHFRSLDTIKRENIGTIHTVQGKEARVVILVLGSDPQNEGARMWASKKPNLVNVAATRAKNRFYVVGNKQKWENKRYFKDIVALLN
ncbi:AAA domain-containing protein [Sulfurimonas sp.]|uniref:AAA domain-containing protein n=1 Tax=Sulfurimonas sp. TaxID=2022749 RepID=UPI003566D947